MRVADEYEKYFSYINPSLMYSATVEGALENGKDAYQSGVKYNNSSVLTAGFATLTDAVSAVKEFVYEKKRITLAQLKQALSDNWSGYGNLRATVLASPHKYGNDDDAADKIAADLAAFESSVVNFRPNAARRRLQSFDTFRHAIFVGGRKDGGDAGRQNGGGGAFEKRFAVGRRR